MARNSADEKWVHPISTENEVEEDEEALSLCDLPISEENQSTKEEEAQPKKTEEDFDFGSWGDSDLTESVMCAADEVFFQGQILPLRHSISSDSGLAMFRMDSRNPSRCVSRSDSMDHCYPGGFTSVSSRSSSIRSHRSSSSGSSTNTTIKVRNQFHSHPSPKPQIRLSSSRHGNFSHHSHKSTIWSFFRVGVVPAPGIELQDLKVRSNNSKPNKSFGSRNSTSSNTSSSIYNGKNNSAYDDKNGSNIVKKKKQSFFGGCKCSVNAVETVVPSRAVIIKSNCNNEAKDRQATKKTKQPDGKQATSLHRTFEWLKELSLAGVPDEA